MNLSEMKVYLRKNGPSIATLASMVLTGLSVYFAIKNSQKTADIVNEYSEMDANLDDIPIADRKSTDKLALKLETGKKILIANKESVICAGGSIFLTWLANRENCKTIAGLAGALAISEDKLKRVYSKIGKEAREAIESDVPWDENTPPVKAKRRHRREEIAVFYESYTGTLFESNCRDVDDAITRAKSLISKERYKILNYNKWRSLIGLEDIPAGTCVGWNRNDPFVPYQKLITIDGREVIGIFYENDPVNDYFDINKF